VNPSFFFSIIVLHFTLYNASEFQKYNLNPHSSILITEKQLTTVLHIILHISYNYITITM